ncbi:hypothetical protein [uncultured Nocardioides sp.]|uniref:hypothetical protein n=1 Tax=uncultured Nocardioides sp. TaxID=198441 RepID=UPI0026256755|nr:hypothetical protein [uncultured Nocardioides sp.]
MSTLRERLGDLAGSAPVPPPDPDLWDRARRYHRRRRVGTAAVAAACVLAVVALVGLDTWQRSPSTEPAAPGTDPALPARFWEPSPWLPGNDGEPTGPLAGLMETERKTFLSSGDGVVGVSATTGEYRFLDLPDDAHEAIQGHALSPDGTKVAYWLTGETSGTPQTGGGQSLPVVGVGVWDSETGEVIRHVAETEHGLAPDELLWADRNRLVVRWAHWRVGDDAPTRDQGGAYDRVGLRVWQVGDPKGPVGLGVSAFMDSTNGAGQLLLSGGKRPVLDLETAERTGPQVKRKPLLHISALSPDGTAIAYPRGNRNPGRLVVATASGVSDPLVEDKVWAAVGWVDDDTVAFVTRDADLDPISATIESISLSTGERTELIEAGTFQPLPGNLATDLLAVEPRDFAEPASPWNPRIVGGLLGSAVLVALMWLWGWRRSVRP